MIHFGLLIMDLLIASLGIALLIALVLLLIKFPPKDIEDDFHQ